MNEDIKLGAPGFLNSEPLIWPLEKGIISDNYQIVRETPASLSELLVQGAIDCAIAPVVTLLKYPYMIPIPEIAIACRGVVSSVLLIHNEPIDTLKTIWLDPSSKTSNLLIQVLMAKLSKSPCQFVYPDPENDISSASNLPEYTGRLIIGDAALAYGLKNGFETATDLGALWKKETNLAFVFAFWIARNSDIAAKLTGVLKEARDWSLKHLHEIIEPLSSKYNFPVDFVDKYLRQRITYVYGAREEAGLNAFTLEIKKLGLTDSKYL